MKGEGGEDGRGADTEDDKSIIKSCKNIKRRKKRGKEISEGEKKRRETGSEGSKQNNRVKKGKERIALETTKDQERHENKEVHKRKLKGINRTHGKKR